DLQLFKEDIRSLIESEIVQRYHYKKGVLRHQLSNDAVYDRAIKLLTEPDEYHTLLRPDSLPVIPPAEEIREKIKDQYS
ncbi:MAG: peptidase S41, partial [Proteiniphilum sp.]